MITIYVSSVTGDDKNNGLGGFDNAKRTITSALRDLPEGKEVQLRIDSQHEYTDRVIWSGKQ